MLSPADQFMKDWREIPAARRRVVFLSRRVLRIAPTDQQAAAFEPLQAISQNVAGDLLRRSEELDVSMLVIQQEIAHHQQRPAISDEIERAGDRAG